MPILFLSRVLAHSLCDARKQVINVPTLLIITASASPAGLFCLPVGVKDDATWHCYVSQIVTRRQEVNLLGSLAGIRMTDSRRRM